MNQRSLTLSPPTVAEDSLGFFRWGHVAGKVVVTNDAGDWSLLSDTEFGDLLAGRIAEGHARFPELHGKGFLRDGLDVDALTDRVALRNRHVGRGPHLHVVTLSLRGNPNGAAARSADDASLDMSRQTAEKVAELALQSSSTSLSFEFQGQGGEPLRNFDVLRHFVDYTQTRNRQVTGKTLSFAVISNLSAMTEEIAEWLIANDVRVQTSFDGPADVHDWNRKWKGGSPHADVVRWIEYFSRRYGEIGREPGLWHVDALLTTTRRTLDAWREVVDEYVARGLRSIHLRPLDPSRFSRDTWLTIGYTPEEYLAFYRRALDYVVELNRRGIEIVERMASIIATKILTSDDPGIVDLQSPSGSGTGQIAYNVDGRVFPCDEARVVDAMGDPIFELGSVRGLSMSDILRHPTVRAIAAASLLDAQPMCADCWNKPFCGFSPVRNFITQGDLFGQRLRCFECKEHMAVSTRLVELLSNEGDAATMEILKRWTTNRGAREGRASTEAP